MANYQVVVGNIGTVYLGSSASDARANFQEYALQSKDGTGRAAKEQVILFVDGEIQKEYIPDHPAYIVICLDDTSEEDYWGSFGPSYVLATRQTFDQAGAKKYAASISPSRKPMIVGALRPFAIARL